MIKDSSYKIKKFITTSLIILLGNAMSAMSLSCFALPYNMVVSSLSGIGRTMNHLFGWDIPIVVGGITVILFAAGLIVLGKRFAMSVAVGAFSFPLFLALFQNMEELHHLVDDPLLAAICAGVLDGVGIGIIVRAGGATGGIDIPCIILNKYTGIKVGTAMAVTDICIYMMQLPFTRPNGVILGILYALIYSIIMNQIAVMGQGGVQLLVVSDKYPEINEELLHQGFGTSIIPITSGYLHEEKHLLMCVSSTRYCGTVKSTVLEIDPHAFITMTNVNEINGNGFTTIFSDEDYIEDVTKRSAGAPSINA
ncbi:MAG: YitT family protein [Eubacterium sp.]|nr:YitT family protein [Eubacterium sp.]